MQHGIRKKEGVEWGSRRVFKSSVNISPFTSVEAATRTGNDAASTITQFSSSSIGNGEATKADSIRARRNCSKPAADLHCVTITVGEKEGGRGLVDVWHFVY